MACRPAPLRLPRRSLAGAALSAPLLNGPNEFRWTENRWMLEH